MSGLITLKSQNFTAQVNPENGQLVSLVSGNVEYFHDGGKPLYHGPGWRNSEIIPFPIFGPADNQKVKVGEKAFYLEQHGISRHTKENPFLPENQSKEDSLTLVQRYDGRKIPNPRYEPGNGRPQFLNWLPYTLEKRFELTDEGLTCKLTLTNNSALTMPYMVGWHPAFKVFGEIKDGEFLDGNKRFTAFFKNIASLEEVISASETSSEGALMIKGISSVIYQNKRIKQGIRVSSDSFGRNVMLWCPGRNAGMLCIEHTSKLPVHHHQNYFKDFKRYESLSPEEKKTFTILVQPLI